MRGSRRYISAAGKRCAQVLLLASISDDRPQYIPIIAYGRGHSLCRERFSRWACVLAEFDGAYELLFALQQTCVSSPEFADLLL